MSTERKVLRTIMMMEKANSEEAPDLPGLTRAVGISSTALGELLNQLSRKGYVTTDGRTTPAGQRVATQPLGQVILRRQPTGRQVEDERRESNAKPKSPKVFTRSTKIPMPLVAKSVIRASRNTSAPLADANWQPPTLPKLPKLARAMRQDAESFVDVRESELEELKPHLG